MKSFDVKNVGRLCSSSIALWIAVPLLMTVACAVGSWVTYWYVMHYNSVSESVSDNSVPLTQPISQKRIADSKQESDARDLVPSFITVPHEQWNAAGIEVSPIGRAGFSRVVRLTGKISLDQDRVAHIFPIVEGTVDNVSVRLGQSVKADELLVTIHSREIGKAKLDLYQARQNREMAVMKDRFQTEIGKNARELLKALSDHKTIGEIDSQFKNRPMGDYRERLLAAYSNYARSQADVSRLENVTDSGAISGKQLLAARANLNADQATYQARLEQIEYEITTSLLLSSQNVKEAQSLVAVAATNLQILGCKEEDIISIDPAQRGNSISHYLIRAPFDGTVIAKDVVLHEQVRPDKMVLGIADLSTVWIEANVYEEHVALLSSLNEQSITVRSEAFPGQTFKAQVFYTGEIMDEASRTIAMRAVSDNKEGRLKPGMFVTVEFSGYTEQDVLQVPLTAVQEHEGKKFVFLQLENDRFERRQVKVGAANETTIVIHEGLTEGERVVVRGGFILKSQMLSALMGEE